MALGGDRFTLDWHGDRFERDVREAASVGLTAAAVELSGIMAGKMGTQGGGVVGLVRGLIWKARRILKGKTRDKYYSAPPGAYPGVRLGNLRNSITFTMAKPDKLEAAAGAALSGYALQADPNDPDGLSYQAVDRYGVFLEFGTAKMAARPWALRSLRENRRRLHQTFLRFARAELRKSAGGAP